MPALAIVQAAQSIMQSRVAEADPPITVMIAPPGQLDESEIIYLFHDGHRDLTKTNDFVHRTHSIQIHLMVRVITDEQEAEVRFLPLADTISDAYYTNRRLDGTCQTSEMRQNDGRISNDNAQYIVTEEGASYRVRWWTLEATEYLGFQMQ